MKRSVCVVAALAVLTGAGCDVEDHIPNNCRVAIGVAFLDAPVSVRDRMQQISYRESRWTPDVVNSSGHTGCLQLSPIHRARAARLGYTWADMRRAWPNARVARDLYDDAGLTPWRMP